MVSDYSTCYGGKGGNRVLGSLKISLCEDRRLIDTPNLNCEDRGLQKCLVSKTKGLATKPEDSRFEFLTGKIRV